MKKNNILVFSNDPAVISPIKGHYDIEVASSRNEVLKRTGEDPGALLVIDCDMKDAKGLTLYREVKKMHPDVRVIMLSSTITIPEAVEAAKLGVGDIVRKPALADKLIGSVKNNLSRGEAREIRLRSRLGAEWLMGSGNKISGLFKNLEFAIKEGKNIIFVCESGVDVLSLANIIRDNSGAGQKLTVIDIFPFQKESLESIFWTVLQEALVDSDIIYFERFSIADDKHKASILDYIKSRAFKGRVRVIAGAQAAEVSDVFNDWEKINVPALRERKEDLPEMLEAYIDKYSVKHGKSVGNIGLDALKAINSYSWPGNYRELECAIENAVMACEDGSVTLKELGVGGRMIFENLLSAQTENLLDFKTNIEKRLVNIYYKKTGSEDMAANLLDIPRSRATDNLSK